LGLGGSLRDSATAGVVALAFGLVVRVLAGYLRDHGPAWDGVSLAGNGAIVVLLAAPLAMLVGVAWCWRRRAWAGLVVVPVAIVVGLVGVLGPV
jgi:hypothetical protein